MRYLEVFVIYIEGSNPSLTAILKSSALKSSNTLKGKVVFGVRKPSFFLYVNFPANASFSTARLFTKSSLAHSL